MAIHAILWRGFVEQDRLVLDIALQRVAHRATHIRVAARQRKLSALVMVKRGRRPALLDMAIPAFRDPVFGGKLATVRICMAGFAILRRPIELNLVGTGEHFVTFVTSDRAMSPDQGKFRFRMVEAADIDPGPGTVAGFAAQRGSIGAFLSHALLEFALVRIAVAGRACAVREMERQNLVRSSAKSRLVALRAGDGHVRPGQHKPGVLVLGNGKRRAMKVLYGMAILATVLVGSGGKLLVMRVLMAIRAGRELHFVDGVLAGRRVAFVASDARVLPFERIMRCRMLFHAK